MTHRFSATLTADDWIAAHWLVMRKAWLWRKLLIATLLGSVAFGLLMTLFDSIDYGFFPDILIDRMIQGLFFGPILVACCTAIVVVLTPIRIRRNFVQLRIDGRVSDYEFDEDGIRWANRDSTASLAWNRFISWSENGRLVVLQMSDASYVALPKAQMETATQAALADALGAASVKKR